MIQKTESENYNADISPELYKVKYLKELESCYAVGKLSDERDCSKELHLQSYLEILWSEMGYFGLLGNNLICLLSYYILSKDKVL